MPIIEKIWFPGFVSAKVVVRNRGWARGLTDWERWLDIKVRDQDWRMNDLVVGRRIVALRVLKKEYGLVEAPVTRRRV